MDMDPAVSGRIWQQAAQAVGWRHSPAHDGWISDGHVDHAQYGEGGHPSSMAAEDACFLDGIETIEDAVRTIGEA